MDEFLIIYSSTRAGNPWGNLVPFKKLARQIANRLPSRGSWSNLSDFRHLAAARLTDMNNKI